MKVDGSFWGLKYREHLPSNTTLSFQKFKEAGSHKTIIRITASKEELKYIELQTDMELACCMNVE